MKIKTFVTIAFALCILTNINAQTKAKTTQTKKPTTASSGKKLGYQYLLSANNLAKIYFTKAFSKDGEKFVTTYKIYSPVGKHMRTVVATHDKELKKIIITVDVPSQGIFSEVNKEEHKYETPSLKLMGFRGAVGAIGGDDVPNQLTLKFKDEKFDYVNVTQILGYHENDDPEFYILEE